MWNRCCRRLVLSLSTCTCLQNVNLVRLSQFFMDLLCFNEICVMGFHIQFVEACIITDCSPWFVSQQGHGRWQQRQFFEPMLDFFFFFLSPFILICCADEHLPVDDYPSDQCCSWTWRLSPCLNVSLVNARLCYYALSAVSVFDLGQRQCHCQVDFIAVNELFFPCRLPLCTNNAHGPMLLIRRERSVTVEL